MSKGGRREFEDKSKAPKCRCQLASTLGRFRLVSCRPPSPAAVDTTYHWLPTHLAIVHSLPRTCFKNFVYLPLPVHCPPAAYLCQQHPCRLPPGAILPPTRLTIILHSTPTAYAKSPQERAHQDPPAPRRSGRLQPSMEHHGTLLVSRRLPTVVPLSTVVHRRIPIDYSPTRLLPTLFPLSAPCSSLPVACSTLHVSPYPLQCYMSSVYSI